MSSDWSAHSNRFPSRHRFVRQGAAILCAVAVGALLFSARIAPLLFEALPDDRALAGRIAGRGFESAYWIALVVAVAASAVVWFVRSERARIERVLAALMLIDAALLVSWVAPAIAHHGAKWPWSFASLHGTGGAMHLLLAAVALALSGLLLTSRAR